MFACPCCVDPSVGGSMQLLLAGQPTQAAVGQFCRQFCKQNPNFKQRAVLRASTYYSNNPLGVQSVDHLFLSPQTACDLPSSTPQLSLPLEENKKTNFLVESLQFLLLSQLTFTFYICN